MNLATAILLGAGVAFAFFFVGVLWEVFWSSRRRDKELAALHASIQAREREILGLLSDCELLADELHKTTGGDYRGGGERLLAAGQLTERHRLVRLLHERRAAEVVYADLSEKRAGGVRVRTRLGGERLEPRPPVELPEPSSYWE